MPKWRTRVSVWRIQTISKPVDVPAVHTKGSVVERERGLFSLVGKGYYEVLCTTEPIKSILHEIGHGILPEMLE